MENNVENMKKQKKMYENVKSNIPSEIIKLQSILDDLNDKTRFKGYGDIDNTIIEIENSISNLKSIKISLELAINKLSEKINELDDSNK